MRRPSIVSIAVVTTGLVAVACGSAGGVAEASSAFPMTIQNCGRDITIFQQPERIMAVGNVAVNELYAAGAADLITVRAGFHDGPLDDEVTAAVEGAEALGENLSLETIIGSGVDTVVSYGLSYQDGLADAGISSYVSTTSCQPDGTFQQVFDDVERLGELFGTEDQARAAVEDMEDRVAAVQAASEGAPAQTTAAAYYFGETITINGNQAISQGMMDALGLTNVFADLDAWYSEGNLEELIDADPEVILLIYGWFDGRETFEEAKQRLVSTPGMADVRAVLNDRIVGIPSAHGQNDPGAVDGLEEIAEQLGRDV